MLGWQIRLGLGNHPNHFGARWPPSANNFELCGWSFPSTHLSVGGMLWYGKYEHVRRSFSAAMLFYLSCLAPPAATLSYFVFALWSCPLPLFTFRLRSSVRSLALALTLHLCSPSSLFPLLVFLIAIQSHSLCRLLYIFALLTHHFRCYSSSSLAGLAPPAVTVCVFSQLFSTDL